MFTVTVVGKIKQLPRNEKLQNLYEIAKFPNSIFVDDLEIAVFGKDLEDSFQFKMFHYVSKLPEWLENESITVIIEDVFAGSMWNGVICKTNQRNEAIAEISTFNEASGALSTLVCVRAEGVGALEKAKDLHGDARSIRSLPSLFHLDVVEYWDTAVRGEKNA